VHWLAHEIDRNLPSAESKIWHSHPVWFLQGNPIVGFSKQKPGIRLMLWSGAEFVRAVSEVLKWLTWLGVAYLFPIERGVFLKRFAIISSKAMLQREK
jgi:hypothetical protein